tara:strand:+ start:2166 stop:2390 length:225 start_codon:yes stop_codon:yes gene_type:complete
MGQMCVLDQTGDTKTIWDPNEPDEVKAAKKQFKSLTEKGYRAFRVDEDGEKDGQMDEFDPGAGKIIFVKQMVGG